MATIHDVSDFGETLEACSPEQLDGIVRLWGMQGETDQGRGEKIRVLEDRASADQISARFVWEYLTPDERTVLFRLLTPSSRMGASYADLMKKTRLAQPAFTEAVERLKYLALVFDDTTAGSETKPLLHTFTNNQTLLYETGREFFKADRDRSKKTLDEILTKLDEYTVYAIFQNYDIRWLQAYTTRASLARMIATTLINVSEPLEFVRRLDVEARELYLWLRRQGGLAKLQDARAQLHFDDFTLSQALRDLERSALAFDTFSEEARTLFIPSELRANLAETADSASPKVEATTLESEPTTVRYAESTILYDLAVLINAIHQQNIEPTQAGRVPKRIATKLRPLLKGHPREDYEGYDDYHEMLLYALEQLEVIQLAPPPLPDLKARYEPGPQLGAWSKMGEAEQAKRLLRHWLTSDHWIDIAGIAFDPWDMYSIRLNNGREALLKQLRKCTPGRWYVLETVLRKIWEEDPAALQAPSYLYISPREQKKPPKAYVQWLKSDGEIYLGMLASSLHELGLVHLGYNQVDVLEAGRSVNPSAFMLTDLFAAIGGAAEPARSDNNEQVRLLVVQPNFEVLLLQSHLPTLYSLLPFTQVGQIGVVSRLTLTRQSLLRGMEIGILKTVPEIIRVLEEHSQKELPQNVVYTLNDWGKQYKEARITPVLMLEVSSEAVAEQISASPNLARFRVRHIAPTVLVIDIESNLPELRKALDKEGITTRIGGSTGSRSSRRGFPI